jgi:GTPase
LKQSKGIIVGISTNSEKINVEEIKNLTRTAGIEICEVIVQHVKKFHPATGVGEGKVQEIAAAVVKHEADVVIFDTELTPSQQNNLREALDATIIDRTGLILEIFGQRAKTKEGKIQVELAQLTYKLSRLKGLGIEMSRLGGSGSGSGGMFANKGPGETKLETDRRTIRDKIARLKDELKDTEKSRSLHRRYREKKNIPQVAIVGYTNAGKSTLLNLLTSADTFVEDKLFATLDPTTKKLKLSTGKQAIITDTVGFIEKLPHHLVDAFKSTFEEIKEADLILHVIDIANPEFHNQTLTVKEVLKSMEADKIPTVYVYNKIDVKGVDKEVFLRYPKERPFTMLSALTGEGSSDLLQKVEQGLSEFWVRMRIKIEHVDSWIMAMLMSSGHITKQEDFEHYIEIEVEMPKNAAAKLRKTIPDAKIIMLP